MLWLSLALAAPPSITPSATEKSSLDAGEVVVRAKVDEGGSDALGLVVVKTTAQKLWTAILDIDARVNDSSDLKAAVIYEQPSRWDFAVRYTVSILGWGGDFHIRYHWAEAENWCTYALDPAQENILLSAEGSYRVDPYGDAQLLTYHTRNKTKIYTPEWVQKRIAASSMGSLLDRLRKRAESL
jgi:hypothetical protein